MSGLRSGPFEVALLVAAAGTVTSCASPTSSTGSAIGSWPAPRTPVLAACPRAGSGSGLPGLALRCLSAGPTVDPARLGGSPVLVTLWASWCVPCQQEMPALQRACARYGRQVRFVGVDTEDDPDSAKDFLAAVGVHYLQVIDDWGDLLHHLGGTRLRVTLIVDARGRVVFTRRGQLRDRDLAAALASAR